MASNSFLSISDYDLLVQNLSKFAKDKRLASAIPFETTGVSKLYAFTGGFSRVYKVRINNRPKALRCWHKDPGKVQTRFPAISDYLSKNSSPYLVDIVYIPNAITFKGKDIAVSLMDWIEGETLLKFLERNINNSNLIKLLAQKFLEMAEELHKNKIAHGDLQAENIMVYGNGENVSLRLIDYDSLYIPLLPENNLDELVGLPSFQHPNRKELIQNKSNYYKADYFSELVIFLSLIAYAQQPALWVGSKERLIFDSSDYIRPNNSKLIKELLDSPNNQVAYLTKKLVEYCQISPNNLQPIEKIISSSGIQNKSSTVKQNDFEQFFQTEVKVTSKPKTPTKKAQDIDDFFGNSISVKTNNLVCQRGHPAPKPNPIDPFCPTCNDFNYFFGPGQNCPSCNRIIPKRIIARCPGCGAILN